MSDLQYIEQGLFTSFVPDTKDGEIIWGELLKQTEGTGKVLTMHAKSVIKDIRKAGYSVSKAKKATKADMDKILSELDGII